MFTINYFIKGGQKPLPGWFIIVNGHKCHCKKSIAKKISPIINEFYEDQKNENLFFATEILDNQTFSDPPNPSDPSNPSENSNSFLCPICIMISKLFSGEQIICQKDNFEMLFLIGKHFKIQKIIDTTEKFQKYTKTISSHLKESTVFIEMIKLEKMLLFEMNAVNIETKVKEYESLIKKIPIDCFINFLINIVLKNYHITKVKTNEFVIEIIKNVDKFIPDTFSRFLSIICHKFILNNSILTDEIYKFNKKEINSLIHQLFVDGLMENIDEKIRFKKNEIIIPKDLLKYFIIKGKFLELVKESNTRNNKVDAENQFFGINESIKNDNIDSFLKNIVSSQIDINSNIESNITNQLSFIDDGEKCSLIELSAFFGSIKCFTYLFNKQAKIEKNRLSYFAVAGGNPEIIHICEREECVFNEKTLDISIEYHKHQITKWLIDTKDIIINEGNLRNSIIYYNIKTLRYLIKIGIIIDKMMIFICESNNIILLKWLGVLIKNYEMKMIFQDNNMTALHFACEQNNVEIVKYLISRDDIDINSISHVINWKFQIIYNVIKHISKSNK